MSCHLDWPRFLRATLLGAGLVLGVCTTVFGQEQTPEAAEAVVPAETVVPTDPPAPVEPPIEDGAPIVDESPVLDETPLADPGGETTAEVDPSGPSAEMAGGEPGEESITINAAPEPGGDEAVIEAAPELPTDIEGARAAEPKPLPRGVINPTNVNRVPPPVAVSGGITTADPVAVSGGLTTSDPAAVSGSITTSDPVSLPASPRLAGVPPSVGNAVSNDGAQDSLQVRALPSTGVGSTPAQPRNDLANLLLLSGVVACLSYFNDLRKCLGAWRVRPAVTCWTEGGLPPGGGSTP